MKAVVIRYLNEIVSLAVLMLMSVALVAGQTDATTHGVSADLGEIMVTRLERQY